MPDLWMDVDTALSEVPVNIMPLLDDTDFKTRETAVAYNAAGMDLVWNFVTTAGAFTQTAVTPTTGGNYDWTHQGDGIYTIEIPASGGASINNDTEGFGWFTGLVTGVLPWRGPTIGFRAAGLNDALIDGAYSTTRGLAGTALPNAAAEAAGGLFTRGTGAGQINQAANGQIDSNLTTAGGDISSGAGLAALGLAYDTNAYVPADTIRISGDNVAANNAESFFDGTGYAGTNNVIPTVTTLTNLPAITSNWLTAAGIAAGALNGKGDWNIGKTGYALSSAGVQAIWDALTSALTTVGSIGKRISDYLDVLVSSRASQTSLNTMASDTSTGITGIKNQTDQFTFSTGGVDANVAAIVGDTTPAGNLQADYNGTGYNKATSEIGTVAVVTSVAGIQTGVLASFFEEDSGLAYGDAVAGSVVKEIADNAGGGGGSDWTATEKEHIRYRLQIDGTQTTPTVDAPVQLPVDAQKWAGDTPNPLIGGRVDAILGSFLIDESRVDAACAEAGQTQSFTTNLTETEDDYYAGWVFMFTDAGPNRATPRVVRLYNGTTKEITLVTPLPANTTNGHAFSLIALTTGAELTDGSMSLNKSYTSSAVLDSEQAGFLTPGTIGESINEAATNTGLAAQDVRDAMKLAPTAGAAAGGSVDDLLATVETNTQNIETDTQDIQTRLPVALVSGRMDSNMQAAANGVITAAVIATGAIDADALAADAVDEILDEVIEGSLTLRQALRVLLAALANKASGGGTTTVTFRDLADSKARITATVDANGNRTAVTLDGS